VVNSDRGSFDEQQRIANKAQTYSDSDSRQEHLIHSEENNKAGTLHLTCISLMFGLPTYGIGIPYSRGAAVRVAIFASFSLQIHRSLATSTPSIWSSNHPVKHRHTFFDPKEIKLEPPSLLMQLQPPILDPKKDGTFAQHTLHKRLPAVVQK
jgi:hypothetical protein